MCLLLLICLLLTVIALCDSVSIHQRPSSLARLSSKVRTESLPIFEFSRELDDLLQQQPPPADAETRLVHQCYLDALRDHYFQQFKNSTFGSESESAMQTSMRGKEQLLNQCKTHCLREATAAMKAAAPTSLVLQSEQYTYISQILELEADIDDYIRTCSATPLDVGGECDERPDVPVVLVGKWSAWKNRYWTSKNQRRLKWLAGQALLLLINFAQFEVNRQISERAAEKRLAEVPEFPLL